jgi:hypothetical protein
MPQAGRGGRALYPTALFTDSVMVVRFDECNAIDGARCNAQFATRAFGLDDRVHELRRTEYRIYRTGLQAQCAADTGLFINAGDGRRPVFAELCIERQGTPVE